MDTWWAVGCGGAAAQAHALLVVGLAGIWHRRTTFIYVSLIICDVGPRDGLQNEDRVLEPAVRAELSDRLAAAGLRRIEAASFVNPKLVPQMAGAEEGMVALHRRPDSSYGRLVLNEMGYDRAIRAGAAEGHYWLTATAALALRDQ